MVELAASGCRCSLYDLRMAFSAHSGPSPTRLALQRSFARLAVRCNRKTSGWFGFLLIIDVQVFCGIMLVVEFALRWVVMFGGQVLFGSARPVDPD